MDCFALFLFEVVFLNVIIDLVLEMCYFKILIDIKIDGLDLEDHLLFIYYDELF